MKHDVPNSVKASKTIFAKRTNEAKISISINLFLIKIGDLRAERTSKQPMFIQIRARFQRRVPRQSER